MAAVLIDIEGSARREAELPIAIDVLGGAKVASRLGVVAQRRGELITGGFYVVADIHRTSVVPLDALT